VGYSDLLVQFQERQIQNTQTAYSDDGEITFYRNACNDLPFNKVSFSYSTGPLIFNRSSFKKKLFSCHLAVRFVSVINAVIYFKLQTKTI